MKCNLWWGKTRSAVGEKEIFILIVRLEKISEKVAAELVKEMNFIGIKQGGRGSGRSSVSLT